MLCGQVGSYSIQYSYAADANNAANSATTSGAVTYGVKTPSGRPTARHGNTLPIQLELTDLFGIGLSNSWEAVTATGIALESSPNSVQALPAGNGSGQSSYSSGLYTLNLNTTGLAAGGYILYFTAAGDPMKHSVQFVLS